MPIRDKAAYYGSNAAAVASASVAVAAASVAAAESAVSTASLAFSVRFDQVQIQFSFPASPCHARLHLQSLVSDNSSNSIH